MAIIPGAKICSLKTFVNIYHIYLLHEVTCCLMLVVLDKGGQGGGEKSLQNGMLNIMIIFL